MERKFQHSLLPALGRRLGLVPVATHDRPVRRVVPYCRGCGYIAEVDESFCGYCGSALVQLSRGRRAM